MALFHNPRIVTSGLQLALDIGNTKSFRGEATTNLLPNPTLNAYPTINNQWGTYNTNQYNGNQYFSIGTISSVTSNIVATTTAHPLRSYDVVTPQTTGGGVTAGVNYLVKKISSTEFSLHSYNSSQDGSQGYINLSTGNHKVYDAFAADTRISVNSTSFPTMWWGPPHLPNSGLVKEIITNGFTHPDTLAVTDCIRQHYIRTDDVKDGMAYNVDATVTAGQPVTVSFYYKPMDARAVGKSISYQIYNYTGGNAASFSSSFTIGPVGVWQRFTYTFTPTYGAMISYWFAQSNGVYSWDMSNIQIEQKSYATAFVAGTRGSTVATGGGISDLSGNSNHGELTSSMIYSSANRGSLQLDGVDDYIVVSNPQSLNAGTSSFSVNCWVKQADTGYNSIVEARATNLHGFIMSINYPSAGQVSAFINTTTDADQNVYTSSASTFSAINTWMNICVVVNRSTEKIDFYLNGTKQGSSTSITSNGTIDPGSGYRYWIGGDLGGPAANSAFGVFHHYNRALSDQEVLQNFNALRKRYNI